jgi:hypothetical protein
VDETGHSGDTGASDGGNDADSGERTRVNGWATPDSPWSNAGAALESEGETPSWRRPSAEFRFARNQSFPSSERVYGSSPVRPASGMPAPAPTPPGFRDAQTPGFRDAPQPGSPQPGSFSSGEIPSSVGPGAPGEAPGWSDNRARYSDLLAHLSPEGGEQARPPVPRTEPGTGADRPAPLRGFDVPAPSSAPPYPYEGDLDDAGREVAPRPQPVVQQRAPVPLVRPATPGGRRVDWSAADLGQESARHALNTQGLPQVPVPATDKPVTDEPRPARPSYDPSSFPRRLAYDPTEPAPYTPPPAYSGFETRAGGQGDPRSRPVDPGAQRASDTDDQRTRAGEQTRAVDLGDRGTRVLPQRVPAQPDVPRVPEPPLVEPTAETPALARIATHLRRGDVRPAQERQEGFDVQAILAAVREVDGVRDASLRSTPAGAHSLRLDLAEGADPAEVSRRVARLLQDRMGLDAAMQGEGQAVADAPPSPSAAPSAPPSAPRPAEALSRSAEALSRSAEALPRLPEAQPRSAETPSRPVGTPSGPAGAQSRSAEAQSRSAEAQSRSAEAPSRPAEVPSRPAGAPEQRSREIPQPSTPVSAPLASGIPASPAARPTQPETTTGRQETYGARRESPATPPETYAERPETRADRAETRADRAETRADRPGTHAEEPQTRAERQETRSERRETRPEQEEARPQRQETYGERRESPATRQETYGEPRESQVTRQETYAERQEARAARPETRAQRQDTYADRPETRSERRESRSERRETVADRPAEQAVMPTAVECGPPRPLHPGEHPGPRIVIENVHVNTFGTDATVEVRLGVGGRTASGVASGPAVDGYLLRLCAMATAGAVDELLSTSDHPDGPVRCFVEHAAAVPFGPSQVAVVVLLLSCGGWVEQLAGSAVVIGDDRHAMVRATLAAVNRRLEALLS